MKLWVDAQLSPHLAPWLTERFGIDASSVRWLGYRDATDEAIFTAAREANAVVMTKDRDFPALVDRYGPPPRVIWITMGNTSNAGCAKFWIRFSPMLWRCWKGERRWWKSATARHRARQKRPSIEIAQTFGSLRPFPAP